MAKEEIKEVEKWDDMYDIGQTKESFSCNKCKEILGFSDCKGCPVYVTHFDPSI